MADRAGSSPHLGVTGPDAQGAAAPGTPIRYLFRPIGESLQTGMDLGAVATTPQAATSAHPALTSQRKPPRRESHDKMDDIIAMLPASTLQTKHGFQSMHERLDARDAAIDQRFDNMARTRKGTMDNLGVWLMTLEERARIMERQRQEPQATREDAGQAC